MPTDPTPAAPTAETRTTGGADQDRPAKERDLPPAAGRALAEAAARRAERDSHSAPKEISGRGGLEPTRYGDWEINGLTSDF